MPQTPLTPSGAGRLVELSSLPESERGDVLRARIEEHRFLVLRLDGLDFHGAVDLLRTLGPINEAKTREEGAVVVEEREGEVFRSNAPLPLHKDGLLTGFDVRFVGIHCMDFVEVEGGRTYVSDSNVALREMDPSDVDVLRTNGVEAMAVDATGYYRAEYEAVWYPFPAFKAAPGREPTLNLGLPHEPGEPESWRVRVAGVDDQESERILGELRRALLDGRYLYHHDWREGDLLLMDNYAVLHGREGFRATRRRLANIQVIGEPAPESTPES